MRNTSLDGLRGFAVILVLLCHHNYLKVGWMGVDLFFVLSGYLITTILRRTRHDQFFWREFWVKRVTRILPPFLLLLAATALLSFPSSPLQTLAYLLSFGDVLAYLRPTFEPLRSLWSLAVEEHFYILWPFAVRLLPRRHLLYILCTLVIFDPFVRAVASLFAHDWQFVYFLTPFRLDGLGFGCLLALAFESPRLSDLISEWSGRATISSIGLLAAFRIAFGHKFTRDNPTAIYNSACYSLVALISVCFIAYLITHPKTLVARVLSWRALVFTGTISYGLYLYQVLIRDALMRAYGFSVYTVFWIDIPIIFVISWLSFHFYEQPLIAWGKRCVKALYLKDRAGQSSLPA
jgi:peptidoglycan/LPS O-acetylase OafA/YrhL